MYGISTQLALGLRVSGAHRTAGSVSRPLPARASGVRPAISLRQRMIDGLSSVNRPVITYLMLGYLTLYEPSPPGALIPRRNQPEMWSAGLSDLGKVFVVRFSYSGAAWK